ncbi:MAG: hypothetical protein MZV70_29095 [Desulfobacterales bacterium]|nr:hypothetical protein [Desulfobacterales bacterium]
MPPPWLLLAVFGYQLNMGTMGSKLGDHLIDTIIRARDRALPGEPEPIRPAGGPALTAARTTPRSKQAYEKSLALQAGPAPGAQQPGLAARHLRRRASARPAPRTGARPAGSAAGGVRLHPGHAGGELFRQRDVRRGAVRPAERALALAKGDRSHYEAPAAQVHGGARRNSRTGRSARLVAGLATAAGGCAYFRGEERFR